MCIQVCVTDKQYLICWILEKFPHSFNFLTANQNNTLLTTGSGFRELQKTAERICMYTSLDSFRMGIESNMMLKCYCLFWITDQERVYLLAICKDNPSKLFYL